MRDYLLWVSTGSAGPVSNIFGESREYDIFLHEYTEHQSPVTQLSEYYINVPGEKLNVSNRCVWSSDYKAIAFLDDDLSFSVDALNRAFRAGDALGLDLWQPALTSGSYCSHVFLRQAIRDITSYGVSLGVRSVPFVEVMMPFFSRRIIEDAVKTFDINESGWGLDCYMWPKLATPYVIDAIPFGHYRAPGRRDRVLCNGLTCQQELWIQQHIHDPEHAPFYPPGYKRPIE